MNRYLALQPWFARGRFVGIDTETHLHVLDTDTETHLHALDTDTDDGARAGTGPSAVRDAFNLTGRPVRRSVGLTSAELPLGPAPEVTGAPSTLADGVLT